MVNDIKPNGKKKHKLPSSTMAEIKPIGKEESITKYARSLAELMFEGMPRASGQPYFSEHLGKNALLVEDIILDSPYKQATIAAVWLHDAAEDIESIDVFSPFLKEAKKSAGIIYLNDLMEKAGEDGENACYIDNLITHRETAVAYNEYFNRIFSFPEISGRERDLHTLTAVIKVCDNRLNTNPDEKIDLERLLKQNPDADQKKLEKDYASKQRTMALNNLSQYLPLIESRLLARIGENNGLFNWQKVRNVVKETYINSLRMYSGELKEANNLGRQRDRQQINGYKWILDEIFKEVAEGTLSIEKIVYDT